MPVKCIIDCDPGCDDVLAILLGLSCPDLEIIAYIPQFGNTDCEAARSNIIKTYGVLDTLVKKSAEAARRFPNFGKTKPLLIRGANGPLSGKGHTAKYFHGGDGLGDISTKYPDIPLPSESNLSHILEIDESSTEGHKKVLELLGKQSDASVTYIALGPLTNLALAIREDEALFRRKVSCISIMGGALDVPGNTSPVAEFNFYADPFAAYAVCEATPPLPIYLMPLDITSRHMLQWTEYVKRVETSFFVAERPPTSLDPVSYFTSAFLRHVASIMRRYGKEGMELHDPLAVFFAMQHAGRTDTSKLAPGWEVTRRDFVIEQRGEVTSGMCVVDRRKGPANEKGRSKAELQAETDSAGQQDPAPVQVDEPEQAQLEHLTGINVVTGTPGSAALVNAMLSGIWGV